MTVENARSFLRFCLLSAATCADPRAIGRMRGARLLCAARGMPGARTHGFGAQANRASPPQPNCASMNVMSPRFIKVCTNHAEKENAAKKPSTTAVFVSRIHGMSPG
eukprot:Amastigsp_a428_37.p5 type:complete len:107 gc:universal Amastigsp_a428_37:441-121(-)